MLDQVCGQDEIVSRLKAFVASKNMPHLLLAGPAGVGKTTCSLAMARALYGENWKDFVLELNASNERGIDVVREKVKDFARTKAIAEVPFKLVYLDEADALTKEAQHALRRTMEDYSNSTRFILSCNYSSKIISPIQSRCAVFRFKPLPKEDAMRLLIAIAKNEGVAADLPALEFIYQASEGDMRKAENLLQACAAVEKNINLKVVNQVVSFAEPQEIANVIATALRGDFLRSKTALIDLMMKHGLSGLDVVKQIQQQIWLLNIPERAKVELIKKCGDYEFRLVEGSNEFIQLAAMLADFSIAGDARGP